MKKILGLTSLALLGVVALTGCSCGKNGEYKFHHFEYEEDGETVKTDCVDTDDLSDEGKAFCDIIGEEINKDEVYFVIDGNKITDKDGKNETYFKIEDEKILISDTEDGKYEESGMLYKNSKIYISLFDEIYIVLDN